MKDVKKRYVLVGTGGRSLMYSSAIFERFPEEAELVGLCDTNPGRMDFTNQELKEKFQAQPIPTYPAEAFDRMVREQKPDVVIVTTRDSAHDTYIIRAMELGCDVITEKPMTIDENKCQNIVDTVRKTGRQVRVTFNYRYSPPRTQVKDLLMQGTIGRILSVDFKWLLNTRHGADYFRRWHREKENSGGLMVHKATHHFDLVNWWLSASPVEVFAMGARSFYGDASGMVEEYGLEGHAERCLDCAHKQKCKFYVDVEQGGMKFLYRNYEQYDGYIRDRCVFGKPMDIEDTMNLVVRYDTGAFMSYSLNAFMPWEGYQISFNGTKGRLEHDCVESVYISGDGSVPGETIPSGTHIRIYPHFKPAYEVEVNVVKGGHGGGDDPLLVDVFSKNPPLDPYLRAADVSSGALSILTGVAANKSMQTGQPVRVESLIKNLPPVKMTEMKTS